MRKRITKILSIILTLCLCLSMLPAEAWAAGLGNDEQIMPLAFFGGLAGNGTEKDPYKISTKEDLETLADAVNAGNDLEGLYFEQTVDINLGGKDDPWTVIGYVQGNTPHPFNGVYDGGNFKIFGLFVGTTDEDGEPVGIQNEDAGLFGHVGEEGVIRRVHVVDCIVYNKSLYVGGIAGRNEGLVEYCSSVASDPDASSGVVHGDWQYAGGIVGYNFGTISYCYSNCDVYGAQKVGGITGGQNGGTVVNCYFRGYVYANDITRAYAGGIAGENDGDSTIDNCYSDGTVEGYNENAYCGAIAGSNDTGSTVENCFWEDSDDTGLPGIGSGMGEVENVGERTPEQFESGEVAWELSKGTKGDGWGQVLDRGEDNPDRHPHFLTQPDKEDESEVYRVTFKANNPKIDLTYFVDPGANVVLPEDTPENTKWYVNGKEFDGTNIQADMDAVAFRRFLFAGETDPIEVVGTYSTEAQTLEINLDEYMYYEDRGPSTTGKFEYTLIEDADGLGAWLNPEGNALSIPAKTSVREGGYTLTVRAHEKEPFIAMLSLGSFDKKDVELTVNVKINKATPLIVKNPTASTINYGQPLADSKLAEDGEAQHPITAVNVEGRFTWADSSDFPTVDKAAIVGYPVTFIPKDTNNYNIATSLVTLTVNKINPNYTAPEPINSIYNGSAQNLIKPGSTDGGTMMYSLDKDGGYSTESPARANVGTYTIWYKVVGGENYNDLGPWPVTATISPAKLSIPDQTVFYNGSSTFTVTLDGVAVESESTSRSVVATLTASSKNVGKYSYSDKAGNNCYTVELSNSNYTLDTDNIGMLTIAQLPVVLRWGVPLTFIYDNKEHAVEAVVNNAIDGDTFKLTYKREGDTTNVATDMGNYTAEVTGLGNDNYTLKNAQNVKQPWYIYQESEHVTLTTEKKYITYGDEITLHFKITPNETGNNNRKALSRDQVEFSANGKSLDVVDVQYEDADKNSATVTLTIEATSANNFSLGANAITAVYSGNKNLSQGMDAITITVAQKPLTAKIIGDTTKTYDGHDTAIGLDVELDGVEECDKDDVKVVVDSYTYNSANVTAATTITANNITLNGAQSGNYKIVDSSTIGKIKPKVIRLEWSGYEELIYNSNPTNVTAIATELIPGDTCEVTVTNGNMINAGAYTAIAALNNKNYSLPDGNTTTQDYKIEPAKLYIPEEKVTYNGTKIFDVELDGVTTAAGTSEKVAAKLITSSPDIGSYAYNDVEADGKYAASEDSNNYIITDGALLIIEKADPIYTPPVAKKLKYNGRAQKLIEKGSVEGGTMEYSLSTDGPWSADLPVGTEVGTYIVWYRIVGDQNYNDIAPQSVKATIIKDTPDNPSVSSNPPDSGDIGNSTDPDDSGNSAGHGKSKIKNDSKASDGATKKQKRTKGKGSHDVPKTGDETNITRWVFLMLLSLVGIVVSISPKKKLKLFKLKNGHKQ